jgi:outer membrane protein assembly factor BamB
MRRFVLLLSAAAVLSAPAALAKGSFPATIPLPNGFQPEGIAIGTGTTFYVGSIPTGAVFAGDVRTGTGRILVRGATGHAATGLKYDRGRLWVSGAATGKAFVYDARTGALIREYELAAGASGATFVNDVVVTRTAAYFTDSNRAVIYKVAIGRNGAPGAATTITLGGDFQLVPGLNLNGITATQNGKSLLAVQTASGKLFSIDPRTGAAKAVDLGGAVLTNGDGLLLRGSTLYVVQNRDNRIAVVTLTNGLTRGAVTRVINDSDFDVPTTIAQFGDSLYAVNARFGTASGPDATYQVVRVRR